MSAWWIVLGAFSWLDLSGWQRPPTPTRPVLTPTPVIVVDETSAPVVIPPLVEDTPRAAITVSAHAAPARVTHTRIFATPGGWAVLWLVHTGDLWDPSVPSELWYAHVGAPQIVARKIADIHRIDRLPLYAAAISPDGTQLAVVVNKLVNWRSATRTGRVTHQHFGRLNLDGSWALPLQTSKPIATNLGTHGGVGDMVWTGTVVRLTTEAECPNPKHQCLYSQRINPATGAATRYGSITRTNMGHQTAPSIVALDDKTSRLVTVSDGAGKYGGLMAYYDFIGGWPFPLSFPFLLDYDPRAASNGVAGAGHRIGTLWRQLRHNDDKLNAAGEPWRMRFMTWDFVRVGSAAPKLVKLSDVLLTEWSTKPGYAYGYPHNSRWNTALRHLDGGGWAVGFQSDGDYVVGQLTETGVLLWRSSVSPAIDYAGDVAVRGERIGIVTTRQTDDGIAVEVGAR